MDLSRIIKRLELIKSLISLEEEDEIDNHVSKLEQQVLSIELENIVIALKEKSYSKAVTAIEIFINQHHNISIYIDPEIDALKLEIKLLEVTINSLSNEKADIEKLIHEFGVRHNKELGELLIKILKNRKEKAKGTLQQEEADEDYNTYYTEYEAAKNEQIVTLTIEERKELKDKYRKASKLCHPDVVSEEQKELATKLFAELSGAYEKNNLKKVSEIFENLENGDFFINKSDSINQKKLLQGEMEKLRLLIIELKSHLESIKESDTYKVINGIDDWDNYFNNTKQKLAEQLNEFKNGK